MTAAKTDSNDLRMSATEFDRIMGKALQVKPEQSNKPKQAKPKMASKKARKK